MPDRFYRDLYCIYLKQYEHMQLSSIFLILFSTILTNMTAQDKNLFTSQNGSFPYEVYHVRLSDSLNIAYMDEGTGKCTLLFLHGLGSNNKAWVKNIEGLKHDYRCIAIDLPGYGQSDQGDYAFTMAYFADKVIAFIEKMKLKNVVLVGHSMGGQIAMHTFLRNSKGIEKLILFAPAGFETFTAQESQWLQSVYTAEVIMATPEPQIIKNFEINFYQMPSDAQFMIGDRLSMRQSPAYARYCSMIPKCVKGMLSEPVFDRLPEVNIPTLVFYGENDSLIPNRFLHAGLTTDLVAKNGCEKLPKCTLHMIPMAGHFVQWEQAVQVNGLIKTFLD